MAPSSRLSVVPLGCGLFSSVLYHPPAPIPQAGVSRKLGSALHDLIQISGKEIRVLPVFPNYSS